LELVSIKIKRNSSSQPNQSEQLGSHGVQIYLLFCYNHEQVNTSLYLVNSTSHAKQTKLTNIMKTQYKMHSLFLISIIGLSNALLAQTIKPPNQMKNEELIERRNEINENYNKASASLICGSAGTSSSKSFSTRFKMASERNRKMNGQEYSNEELYFFLKCGKASDYLTPLAYHANNLKLDDDGYLSQATKLIIKMSLSYIDIKDPETKKSFIDIVNYRMRTAEILEDGFAGVGTYKRVLFYIDTLRDQNTMTD